MKSSTYLLYGYFGTGNCGDDILLQSALFNISARDPSACFYVRAHSPLNLSPDYNAHGIAFEKFDTAGSVFRRFIATLSSYWILCGKADHLVVGGGTLIHDRPQLKSTFLLLCLCAIARLRGCTVTGIGLGMKTIHTLPGKMIISLLLKLFHKVHFRDQRSFSQAQSMGSGIRADMSTDLAFALPWPSSSSARERLILISLVDYIFPNKENSEFLRGLASALRPFLEQGYHLRGLALQQASSHPPTPGDREILGQLITLLPAHLRDQCAIYDVPADADGISDLYSSAALTIGMRFHALIFSSLRHIPFVGLAHEPKIDALCDEFDMPKVSLDANSQILSAAIGKALERSIASSRIADYRILAGRNFSFFEQRRSV